MRMSGGMVPLPVLPVKAPSPNCCPSPSKPFACHTSGKLAKSATFSDTTAPATPLDSIIDPVNSFKIHTSKRASANSTANPFESTPLSLKSFSFHTSAKCAHNSFSCHTSKFTLPQTLCLPHIQDPRGVGNVLVNLPSLTDLRLPHRGSNRVHPARVFPTFQFIPTFRRIPRNRRLPPEKSALLYWNLKVSPRTVTKLRISVVQYLNTAPLVWGFTNGPLRRQYDLSFTVPSQCAEQLRTGSADVAIIPAIEYQRIDDLVILPDMAIASKKQVGSLLIIAKKPIEQVKSFALDGSSRSTQTLTRILCVEKWTIAAEFS